MATNDVPGSVRIRCGEENAHRFDAIESASDFYETNRSDSVAYACDDVVRLADAIEDVLQLVDSVEEREAIAERFDRAVSFDVEVDVQVTVGEE